MSFAERVADRVLEELKICTPEDLQYLRQIVYARGANYREWPIEGAEARLIFGLGRPLITVSSSPTINHHRRRFGIVHELGHMEMHRGNRVIINCTERDIQFSPSNTEIDIEKEANQFASAFLLPSKFVERPFSDSEPSFDLISEWATILDASLTATAIRFTRFTPEPIATVYSYQGKIKYFYPSTEFDELGVFPNVRNPVGANSQAHRLFKGALVKSGWRKVKASEWFREDANAFSDSDMIQEWSIGMQNYDAVLSLLWVDEALGLDD